VLGSIFGPFLGVTLSLYAVQNTAVGVASTLTALPPIILLPVGYFFFKERFGWHSVLGTVLAMIGVFLLFRM
jgi:drug/metabolite transporter (DMT)-like permease